MSKLFSQESIYFGYMYLQLLSICAAKSVINHCMNKAVTQVTQVNPFAVYQNFWIATADVKGRKKNLVTGGEEKCFGQKNIARLETQCLKAADCSGKPNPDHSRETAVQIHDSQIPDTGCMQQCGTTDSL